MTAVNQNDTGKKPFPNEPWPHVGYLGSSTAVDGGSELRLLRMAQVMRQTCAVTLFLPDNGPLYQAAQSVGLTVVNLQFERLRRYHGREWWRWGRSAWQARRRLVRELRQRRIDLLHCNDLIDLPFLAAAGKAGIPVVTHLRFMLRHPIAIQVYRWRVRRHNAFVLPVSGAVRDRMLGQESTIPHHVLYNPLPPREQFQPPASEEARARFRVTQGWSDHHIVIGMVSKLLPDKGHLLFLEVAQELCRCQPDRFRFVMIGAPVPGREPYTQSVRERIDGFPPGVVTWLPGVPHENLPPWLQSVDLFLHLPLNDDSFPGVVVEAMACGRAIIACTQGGIPEQLDGGKAGCLVPPGEAAAVVQQVLRLTQNREEREALGVKAFQRAQQTFSAEQHFGILSSVYMQLLKKPLVV